MSSVKDAFDKHGIDIPFPQRVVYVQNIDSPAVEHEAKLNGESNSNKS